MRALRTLAVACLAAGVLTACSSSGGSTETKAGSGSSAAAGAGASQGSSAAADGGAGAGAVSKLAPKDALLASAAVMDKVGSAKLTVSGGDSDGTADYVWKAPASFLLNTTDKGKEVKALFVNDVMYIGVTEDMAAVAGGKKWMKLDPKESGAAAGGADAGAFTSMMQLMNPSVQLVAAAPTAKLVGAETVAGQGTTHYRSEISVEDMVAKMQLSPELKAQVLTELKKKGSTATADLWINAKGELVQQSNQDASTAGDKPNLVVYSKLGEVKATPAPAAAEVFSLADLLKQ
ncbi:hypothetical protein ACIQBJ_24340 [Kitasatospora sp. NPDC088391]|uniref:hypothetical protein n=1 Tax=Kitasatospora sp. NPDC088391 TaxID=3364074 RepID=UPI00382DC7A5